MDKVILTAISSGSGKTTITCGLLNALKGRGVKVKAYKCGPDYIDPMFHENVIGIPSENLDLFFSDAEYINGILKRNSSYDISVIEGAMGIYDGISGMKKEGSVYDLAVKTNTDIVLILDARGMGNTLISVIKGILLDDSNKLIKGVILNRISENFYNTIFPQIEEETGIKVYGYLEKLKDLSIDSRHLGLKLPNEIENIKNQLDLVKDHLEATVDIDGIVEVAGYKEPVDNTTGNNNAGHNDTEKGNIDQNNSERNSANRKAPYDLKLAVAKDEAFCFYYEDNFRVLKDVGIEPVFFSPIHDKKLPEGISGILLGGGYPELKLNELEANEDMKRSIKDAIDNGMPSLAECGGFMYLHDYIEVDGIAHKMVGAIPGKCFNTGKLVRFGYVDLTIPKLNCTDTFDVITEGYKLKGHEFHYFDSTNNGTDATATKPSGMKSWEFGYAGNGKLWGFPHLYYGSCPEFAYDFASAMRNYKDKP